MSRIGLTPIQIPQSITVKIKDSIVVVKGPKGELSTDIPRQIKVILNDNIITLERVNNSKSARSLHGLTRALIANSVHGVVTGYEKTLEMVGTGYRVKKNGSNLTISVGYSHDVQYSSPEGVTLEIEGNNVIKISGINKQKVGQVAAEIRAIKKPEPYKGKGIRYKGEQVRRKAGKAAKASEGEQ